MLNTCFTALFEDRVDTYQRTVDSQKWFQLSRFNRFKNSDLLSVINLKSDSKKAVSIDKKSHFAVLSIELEDPEQRLSAYMNLRDKLEEIGITKPCSYIVNEFSHIHVYLCFDDRFDSTSFHPMLNSWLKKNELDSTVNLVKTGEPIELPLQRNFAWVNESLSVVVNRTDIATPPAIAMFLSDLNKGMLDLELFTLSIAPLGEIREGESASSILDFSPEQNSEKMNETQNFEPEEEIEAMPKDTNTGSENVVQFKRRPVSQPEASTKDSAKVDLEVETSAKEVVEPENVEQPLMISEPTFEPDTNSATIESSRMLPPPGTTSFKQLSIPFTNPINIDRNNPH